MILNEFKETYQKLNSHNLNLLDNIYDHHINFIDPFNQINSLSNVKAYFEELYENVQQISFDFIDSTSDKNNHFITWNMQLIHPKLNSGKTFNVPGVTHITTNENQKIIYHRDYFDAGVMLYERLPLLGRIIKIIKRQL